MEIFKEEKKKEEKKPTLMSNCPHCGKDFPSRSNKKFCSNNCRSKASMTRSIIGSMGAQTAAQSNPMALPSSLNMGLNGLNPQSQYIIHHQEKEISRWETKYNESEKKREKIEEENKKLRDELAQVKVDQKLSESAKPSGLSGFMESSLMQHLAPHIGPALGDVMKRFLLPVAGDTGMQGINDIVQWLSAQPEQYQQEFYGVVQELAKTENPEQAMATIIKIKNFLTNGIAATTQEQYQQYNGASAAFN